MITNLCGCAHDMALIKGQESINPSKSIALLSVKISNTNHPSYQLDLGGAFVCPQSLGCIAESWLHKAESPYKSQKDSFNEYLLSFELEPGKYNVHAISTYYYRPIVLCGILTFCAGAKFLLKLKFEVKPNSVVYLGHVDAILREKRDNENAAKIFPLIDAALVGYSTGTFDVTFDDRFDSDMKEFIAEYPALKKVKVDKLAMPDPLESMTDEPEHVLSHGDY